MEKILTAIAYIGGIILQERKGTMWKPSEERNYVNALLANLENGEPFTLSSHQHIILQSFAAFCQKGEKLDNLKTYMEEHEFCDYQYVMALYGATHGLAALPKEFTPSLSLFEPSSNYKDFNTELNKLLHKKRPTKEDSITHILATDKETPTTTLKPD